MIRKISEEELGYIESYLKNKGVKDKTTLSELTDHLCILTESELQSETNFDTAFTTAFEKFNKKELLDISLNKESFLLHPQFLNKTFLVVFGLVTFTAFCFGIYLKANGLSGRKAFLVLGGISFGYFFLPLLLLYWLTEFANKPKYILLFMTLFAAFHTSIGLLLGWSATKWIIIITIFFSLIYSVLFLIIPKLKINENNG